MCREMLRLIEDKDGRLQALHFPGLVLWGAWHVHLVGGTAGLGATIPSSSHSSSSLRAPMTWLVQTPARCNHHAQKRLC